MLRAWGKFNARKTATCNHCCFGAVDRTYSGVLGVSICCGYLVSIPALAENVEPHG